MKKILVLAAVSALMLPSCRSVKGGADSDNAFNTPLTSVKSFNEYDLEVSEESVSYTIDVSDPNGRMKLNKLSLKEAKNLALTEAVMVHGCALIINPQYTYLKKGKKILRITVFGFPAYFKNQKKD